MTLTDDQRMLQDTVRPFMADEGAIKKQLRHWRDTGCTDGYGTDLWKQFAELGLTGILIPESQGGAGLGAVEAGVVLEEIGRNLTPSPFLTTAVAAVRALEGSAQAERWFPGILAGETVAALAIDEGKHHDPAGDRAGGQAAGQRLRPERRQAVRRPRQQRRRHPGRGADRRIAGRNRRPHPVRGREGRQRASTSTAPRWPTAARRRGSSFDNVAVDADAVVGEVDGGWAPLSRALERRPRRRRGRAGRRRRRAPAK